MNEPARLCQRCGQREAITPVWVGAAWCGPCVGEQLRQATHEEMTDPELLQPLGSFPHPQVPSLLMDIIGIGKNQVAFVPRVDPDLPAELHYAMTQCRSAGLELRCPECDAPTMREGYLDDRPAIYQQRMVITCYHAAGCLADQDRVLEAFRRWREHHD